MQFCIAGTRSLQRDAFRLVYRAYLSAGLIEPNRTGLRITDYHLSSATNVFVGMRGNRVANTVSLIGDSQLGLPMESIFPDEVEEKRRQGNRVAEVSCLAADPSQAPTRRDAWQTFIGLNRLMAQFARFHGFDLLLIVAHPRHARSYERMMGFDRLGDVTRYPSVRNNLAVPCCLDFAKVDRTRPPLYDQMFGERIPPHHLRWQPVAPQDYHRFQPAINAEEEFVPLPAAC